MVINFTDQKLLKTDLSFEFTEDLIKTVLERILENQSLMEEIKNEVEEDWKSDLEFGSTQTLEECIRDKAERMAEGAVARIRIYCDFDVTIKV